MDVWRLIFRAGEPRSSASPVSPPSDTCTKKHCPRGDARHVAGRTLVADQHGFGRIPCRSRWEISGARHADHRQRGLRLGRDAGRHRIPGGSGRAITRFAALARFAPRSLVLDLADQVSTHLREGMIQVALVGGGDEVRPSR
jgi:hypothetical protein